MLYMYKMKEICLCKILCMYKMKAKYLSQNSEIPTYPPWWSSLQKTTNRAQL